MFQQPATPVKAAVRALQILCTALIAGAALFAIIVSVLVKTGSGPSEATTAAMLEYKDIFVYASAGFGLILFWVARSAYKKKMATINHAGSLENKLNQYREAMIVYMGPLDGAALFSVVVLFLTGNLLVLIITALILAAMFTKFPLPKNLARELNLNWQEQQELL